MRERSVGQAPRFAPDGPLPQGVTVLEASAGTGKTHAITGLAARYVAEGTPLEQILLVTFTRMATGELRTRVRERLIAVERCLRVPAAAGEDPVVALLAARGPAAVASAEERLARALSDFDAATIATTHGFCQEALGGLGIAADLEPGVSFVEDLGDLLEEVVDDLYVRRFRREGKPPFNRGEAMAIARIAVANPGAEIAPATGAAAELRRGLALKVREELEIRKRRLAVMTYDDLLMRLRESLRGADGAAVAARLRARYRVVLVDEFQDTDPVQWEIMRLAFAHEHGTLVLIADPKQAIYAFRGADVYAYLQAAGEAQQLATLGVNRRSDQALIDGYDALFGEAQLGQEGIVYRRVEAAPGTEAPDLPGAPLRIRVLDRTRVALTANGFAQATAAREYIAADVAGDVAGLLASGVQIPVRGPETPAGGCAAVCPGDVAVLVRTNRQAGMIMEALGRAGVPAVINGAGSVFATNAARHWLALLESLERPASIARAHAVALTPFLGWSAAEVAQAPESAWEELHERLHEWARILRTSGVASLLEAVTREQQVPGRVLAQAGGERELTDLRHIGQLLHAAGSQEQLGTTALTGWLRRRIVDASSESGDEERSRRLESDAEAVQVLTIHRSKGLEFPIVYLPYLWDPTWVPEGEPVAFHDPDAGYRRTIDVSLQGRDFTAHRERAVLEQRGEDLRLAYVALTRARHQAVLWWAGTRDARNSPLGRLVFLRQADGTVPAWGRSTPGDERARETFTTLAAQAPGCVSVESAVPAPSGGWGPAPRAGEELAAARFDRTLDRRWRRTSYSDITAGAHESFVASEPEEGSVADEPNGPAPVPEVDGAATESGAAGALAIASPLSELPLGVAVGTLVHQVLEATDFAAADLDGELERALAAAPGRRAVTLGESAPVTRGLRLALETPLGPGFDGRALRDVRREDRLDELGFELPLAGGEQPTGTLSLTSVSAVLAKHLSADDPLSAYAQRLGDLGLRQSLRGYLTGSLDLVVRFADRRFAVIDYKSNWLGDPEQPLTCWHYRPAALSAEMQARHYGLQAVLYLVALHRYLRWRLADYDPERNLAGVLYLFLRGMAGPDTPLLDGRPCGVFAWQPPPGLVAELSDAFDAGGGGQS